MINIDEVIDSVEAELSRYSPALAPELRKALATTQQRLTPEEVEAWVREGLALAQHTPRAWETAIAYFKASPALAGKLEFRALLDWAMSGRNLTTYSASIAASYFESTPAALRFLAPAELPLWAGLGSRLFSDIWQTTQLCITFFDTSPQLLKYLTLPELARFVDFLEVMAFPSCDTAIDCLQIVPTALPLLDRSDLESFIKLGTIIAKRNWRAAPDYWREGPHALSLVNPADRPLFFSLVGEMAQKAHATALTLFLEGPSVLGQIDKDLQGEMLRLSQNISKASPSAAVAFLKNCPTLLERLSPKALGKWVDIGISVANDSPDAGTAFFELGSTQASSAMRRVTKGAELGDVVGTLRLYCKGLTGKNLALTSSQNLVERGIGWTAVEQPTTEGSSIFLPPYYDELETKAENFEAYKVLATHQAAHLEFGTFDFSFERPSEIYEDLRCGLEADLGEGTRSITDFERFFDLFKNRRLAQDIFTILEDARIDARVHAEYAGIRKGYDRLQRRALAKRPTLESLTLRQGVLEMLVQSSLDSSLTFSVPKKFAEQFAAPAGFLLRLKSPDATVEATAEATIRVYNVVRGVPNRFLTQEEMESQRIEAGFWSLMAIAVQDNPKREFDRQPEDDRDFYIGPLPVDYRGVLKPELVQTLMKLKHDIAEKPGNTAGFPIPPEKLKKLLENILDPKVTELVEGTMEATSGLFVSNLMKEHELMRVSKPVEMRKAPIRKLHTDEFPEMSADDGSQSYYYDEWDFLADGYRSNWCRLKEQVLKEGSSEFFDETLREYAGLAYDIKRQFQRIKPELFKRIKRLHDGEDYDLDLVIESVVEKRIGQSPSDRIYSHRNKIERDIALVVLLDMSASTDEEIEAPSLSGLDWPDNDWSFHLRSSRPAARRRVKRIIDLEKESIVLLIRALETTGDQYGVFGFSSFGRDQVEFFVVKDLKERFDDKIKRRIDNITPCRGTRMGPAIRHATSRLAECQAKVRLLLLLSDGHPQDHDYGHDRTEKEYALQDTRMALLEAKRRNIVPFCLTVDKAGRDYLKTMMGDTGYEVVNDIKSLPKRLPNLYKRLTT